MFTVKLYKTEDGETICHSHSCPHYSSFTRRNQSTTITIYKDSLQTEGVDYNVTNDINSGLCFSSCFIENQSGKTIDTYRAED